MVTATWFLAIISSLLHQTQSPWLLPMLNKPSPTSKMDQRLSLLSLPSCLDVFMHFGLLNHALSDHNYDVVNTCSTSYAGQFLTFVRHMPILIASSWPCFWRDLHVQCLQVEHWTVWQQNWVFHSLKWESNPLIYLPVVEHPQNLQSGAKIVWKKHWLLLNVLQISW